MMSSLQKRIIRETELCTGHLPYGITQCYLPLDTDKRALPRSTPAKPDGTRFTYFGGMEGRVNLDG